MTLQELRPWRQRRIAKPIDIADLDLDSTPFSGSVRTQQQARRAYDRALELHPRDEEVRRNRELLVESGKGEP